MSKRDILIVDDDLDYLRLCQAMAEKEEIQASFAGSEEEAWSILTGNSCSMLLIAVSMLGMNGYALAVLAKELQPELIVAVATDAEAAGELPDLAPLSGIATVTGKPYSPEELRQLVRGKEITRQPVKKSSPASRRSSLAASRVT